MSAAVVERKIEGANRTVLAGELGLSRGYVSQVLAGKREPGLGVAKRLAGKLGVTVDAFAEWLEKKGGEVEPVN